MRRKKAGIAQKHCFECYRESKSMIAAARIVKGDPLCLGHIRDRGLDPATAGHAIDEEPPTDAEDAPIEKERPKVNQVEGFVFTVTSAKPRRTDSKYDAVLDAIIQLARESLSSDDGRKKAVEIEIPQNVSMHAFRNVLVRRFKTEGLQLTSSARKDDKTIQIMRLRTNGNVLPMKVEGFE